MADQWFADQTSKEDLVSARRMMRILFDDIGPRLDTVERLQGGPDAISRELHAIRGAVGSVGLAACAHHLLVLEKNWAALSEDDRKSHLNLARQTFKAGGAALLQRFPYLVQK